LNLDEILDQIPAYEEFMTVAELNDSSVKLADENDAVELVTIGKSGEGRPINYLKIGEGTKDALLFAFPHPNEPIGSMTVEFFSRFLAENPDVTRDLNYTWYLIKAIDPDGAALNEGWFKGKFDPVKYARNFYRPAPHEQIEWTFPVTYEKLHFSTPPPETQALMKVIEEVEPSFMFSLHNAGFCGVYYYVTHKIESLFPEFINLVEQTQLPIHRGEPETPYIQQLHPAIFQMFGIQETYDFYKKNDVENPQELINCGTSSDDYLRRITNGKGFTLVCEMPYFYDRILGDHSESEFNRRDKVLEKYTVAQEAHTFIKPKFEAIRKYCDPKSRLYTTVADGIDNFEKRLAPMIHNAKTSPMYEGKATKAQAFDSMVANRFYYVLRSAMTARLSKSAALNHPEHQTTFHQLHDEIDAWVEDTITNTLKDTRFEVIPIQKLVRVQVGSALIAIQHLL
jgi:hypothetical protein